MKIKGRKQDGARRLDYVQVHREKNLSMLFHLTVFFKKLGLAGCQRVKPESSPMKFCEFATKSPPPHQ